MASYPSTPLPNSNLGNTCYVLCLSNGSSPKTSVTPAQTLSQHCKSLIGSGLVVFPFQVLDKLSAISSHSRGSPSITLGTRTPNSSGGSYGRSATRQPSFTRPLEDEDVIDNERVAYSYASDGRSATPPATARRIAELSPRQRLFSDPTSPRNLRLAGGSVSSVLTSPSRRSNLADLERSPPPPEPSRRSPTLTRRPRQPLPKEFTKELFFSDSPLDARVSHSILYSFTHLLSQSPSSSSHALPELASPATIHSTLAPHPLSRTASRSPGVYMTRGSPSPTAGAATFSEQITKRPQRPTAARERRSNAHRTWQSEDLNSPDTETESSRLPGSRYEQRGSSGENSLIVRSVVTEGLRAAGLAGRREPTEGYRGGDGAARRQRNVSGGLSSHPTLLASPAGLDGGDWESGLNRSRNGISSREPITLANRIPNRSIQSVLSPRPGTGMSLHDDGARASPSLRHLKSNTELPDRYSSLGSAAMVKVFTSPSGVVRTLQSKREIPSTPGGSSSMNTTNNMEQHAHLMNEALFMFESHAQKLPRASVTPGIYDDVVRDAQVLVAAAGSLNKALRAASNVAVDEQVYAEVGDDDRGESGEVADVWRRIRAELKEDIRVSDELVRTMTSFMIGVGRMLRAVAASSTPAGDGRQSVESSGRRSAEVRSSLDQHRDESLRRLTAARPTSTSDASSGNGTVVGEWDRAKRASYNSITNESRPGSVLSVIRDGRPSMEGYERPATYTALGSGKRSLSRARGEKERPRLSIPQSARELGFPGSVDGGDRTPMDGPIRSTRHTSLALPPPLPMLPSESLARTKSHTGRLVPKEKRISRNSASTIQGRPTSPPGANSSFSPATAQSSDVQNNPPSKGFTLTSKRTPSVLNGLQQVSGSLSRKRTISATSEIERPMLYSPSTRPPVLRKASSALTSGSVPSPPLSAVSRAISRTTSSSTLSNISGGNKSADAKTRAARIRMSLDSNLRSENDNQSSPSMSAAPRRERRHGNDSYS